MPGHRPTRLNRVPCPSGNWMKDCIIWNTAPKIFFRYYYVNSSTGEKSGTMLTECKWTAADAGGEP